MMQWSLGFVTARCVTSIISLANRSPRVCLVTPHLPGKPQQQASSFQLWERHERYGTVYSSATIATLQRASTGNQARSCRIEPVHISTVVLIRKSAWPKRYLWDMVTI